MVDLSVSSISELSWQTTDDEEQVEKGRRTSRGRRRRRTRRRSSMLGLRVCNWKWRLAEWMLIALLSQLIIAHSWRLNWNYSDDALSSKQVNWQHQQQPGGVLAAFAYQESSSSSSSVDDQSRQDEWRMRRRSQPEEFSRQQTLARQLLAAHPSRRNRELLRRINSLSASDLQVFYPQLEWIARDARQTSSQQQSDWSAKANQQQQQQILAHYNRSSVVIKAFNYKFQLDLELNNNLFGPNLIQKHLLPKGNQQISAQRVEHCYYHARTRPHIRPAAIGAFRTCSGLSGIIHVNNESFVIHPFYDADLSKKHPHIIYRYQSAAEQQLKQQQSDDNGQHSSNSSQLQQLRRQCGNTRLHQWALRQYNKLAGFVSPAPPIVKRSKLDPENCDTNNSTSKTLSKRDVSLTEKHIELALVLSKDMFDKRNSSSRLEVLRDAIQIVNLIDLYFRSANTRVALIYIETWAHDDQIELSSDVKQTLYNFLEYSTRHLYKISMDAAHLLTGGHSTQFEASEVGMSIPDSICTSRAVSVSQEGSIAEPFVAASTIAHMLGHNLGMEHDLEQPIPADSATASNPKSMDKPQVVAKANLLKSASQPSAQSSLDNEDHDDELKSRSISIENMTDERNEQSLPLAADADCHSQCLMSEKFTSLQPPVVFGNLLGGSNQTQLVAMFADNTQEQAQIGNPDQTGSNRAQVADLPFKFSRQSIDHYHRLLRTGHGICLFNKPNQLEDFKTCGNGIVDRGEDCDCGTFQECLESDSCCDPITCRFKADAECISGACCDRCKLRRSGFVCRRSRGECDLPEVCDGKSGQCAPDVHKQNGVACAAGTGYCYLGQCPAHDAQCSELWGSDARKSDRLCFSNFNPHGTFRGNCGYEPNARKLKRCEPADVMCGTLQCQLGDMKPITASTESNSNSTGFGSFSKKTIKAADGSQYECKIIAEPSGGSNPAASSVSYVRDGTKCDTDKVCFNQTCQPISQVYREGLELCPHDEKNRYCSGNGICSTANRCHCNSSWTGHDCSMRIILPLEALLATIPEPAIETSTSSKIIQVMNAPDRIVVMTEAFNSTTSTSTTPAPTSSQSNHGLDKKKHDTLGAPTLVFILVTIVAAVYVGFALMANCYRRTGFIRPDKVLRHHQMNCKMDALRSSFIAKRLADAKAAGDISGELLDDYPNQPQVSQLSTIYNSCGGLKSEQQFEYSNQGEPILDNFVSLPMVGSQHIQQQQQQQPVKNKSQQVFNYFANESSGQHKDAFQFQGQESFGYEPGSGDHLPLLVPSTSNDISYNQSRPTMRSFNKPQVVNRASLMTNVGDVIYQTQCRPQTQSHPLKNMQTKRQHLQYAEQLSNRWAKTFHPSINRATSLGNVNRKQHQMAAADAELASRMNAHRALTTPSRAVSRQLSAKSFLSRPNADFDSCSAPSSPEHCSPYYFEDRHQAQANHALSFEPIDDCLNALNNSNAATSSRRSFRRANQQSFKEQVNGSRSETLKRQQVKLNNLQDLINRLQQLQKQTMLQQQLEELEGGMILESQVRRRGDEGHSRVGVSRSLSRSKQSAEDLCNSSSSHKLMRLASGLSSSPIRRKENIINDKNESVYSMSDSEDGAFVSNMLLKYDDKHDDDDDDEPNTEKAEFIVPDESNIVKTSTCQLSGQTTDIPEGSTQDEANVASDERAENS